MTMNQNSNFSMMDSMEVEGPRFECHSSQVPDIQSLGLEKVFLLESLLIIDQVTPISEDSLKIEDITPIGLKALSGHLSQVPTGTITPTSSSCKIILDLPEECSAKKTAD